MNFEFERVVGGSQTAGRSPPGKAADPRRVVHAAVEHIPLDVRVFFKECRTLAEAGHEVHIVTSEPVDEPRDGVRFHSAGRRTGPPRGPAVWRRARLLLRQMLVSYRVYRTAVALDAEVFHVHEPALIPVGRILKSRGVRIVYDAHEEYREIAARVRERRPVWGRVLAAWYGFVERMAERSFDSIVAATPAIARQFSAATVLHNYPLEAEISVGSEVPYDSREARVIFTGGISHIRGVKELVRALDLLPPGGECRLDLIGRFADRAIEAELRSQPAWNRVHYHGWLSRSEMVEHLGRARAGVVTFLPVPNHTEALPNKLFEYMAAGIPVIASDFPLWREIVNEAGCGLLVDPHDPEAIAAAIRWLLENPSAAKEMGRRGREAVRTKYNWTSEAHKLLRLYENEPGVSRALT